MESLDAYYAILDASGAILAGAGIAGDVLKCLAVSEESRSEGMLVPLVSRILSEHPGRDLKVFTKPEYEAVFTSLGFHLIACAPLAILLEKGRGLEQYCDYLRSQALPGRCGVVVMNANPFTLGHQYLLEQAASQVDHLYVIPVKEDVSDFPYAERLAMIKAGAPDGTVVLDGCDYVISAATFPTYFLKDLSSAAETQMRLDLDLYSRWIAPALGASVRFVGSEPFDALTNRYNQLISNSVEISRLGDISASKVRRALSMGRYREAASLCPATSHAFLLAHLATRALCLELETPLKPGLVCPGSNGAHKDMNYGTMLSGIRALRPWWSRMALASGVGELRSLGIEAEKAMMQATGGVNTHRGAIFALGLTLNAVVRDVEVLDNENNMQILLGKIAQEVFHNQLEDSALHITPAPRGARRIALDGYKPLFEDWLPYYRTLRNGEETLPVAFARTGSRSDAEESVSSPWESSLTEGEMGFTFAKKMADAPENPIPPSAEQRLLLRIMSTLDDTCVIKRAGEERAQQVKKEAEALLESISEEKLKEMCDRYALEGISPGGAADMLALTIFIDSIIL